MPVPAHLLSIHMQWSDWLHLWLHFLMLSLLSIGGAVSTLPDMHRYLVGQQHWLNDTQFNSSIAIAQAAPGPNVLFIALMGWNVGLNAGSVDRSIGCIGYHERYFTTERNTHILGRTLGS